MALEEWKLRLTSAKVEVEVEAELGKTCMFQGLSFRSGIVDLSCSVS